MDVCPGKQLVEDVEVSLLARPRCHTGLKIQRIKILKITLVKKIKGLRIPVTRVSDVL